MWVHEMIMTTRLCLHFDQDEVLVRLLQSCEQLIVSYHEHNSLLDHREEEELSEEERRAAWDEYRAEKKVHIAVVLNCGTECPQVVHITTLVIYTSRIGIFNPAPGGPLSCRV